MGTKVLKEHFNVLLTCSVTDRKKLLIMGKAKQLHSFPKYASNIQKTLHLQTQYKGLDDEHNICRILELLEQ